MIQSERKIDLICMGRVAVDFYADQIHSPLEMLKVSAATWEGARATFR